MKADENYAVNEWNEGAGYPIWCDETFWQTESLDYAEYSGLDSPRPIREAADITAPSLLPLEARLDSGS